MEQYQLKIDVRVREDSAINLTAQCMLHSNIPKCELLLFYYPFSRSSQTRDVHNNSLCATLYPMGFTCINLAFTTTLWNYTHCNRGRNLCNKRLNNFPKVRQVKSGKAAWDIMFFATVLSKWRLQWVVKEGILQNINS